MEQFCVLSRTHTHTHTHIEIPWVYVGVSQYYQHALGDDDSKNVLELVSPGHIFVLVPKPREFKVVVTTLCRTPPAPLDTHRHYVASNSLICVYPNRCFCNLLVTFDVKHKFFAPKPCLQRWAQHLASALDNYDAMRCA